MRDNIDRRAILISLIYFVICSIGLIIFIRIVEAYDEPVWYYHPISEAEKEIPNAVGKLASFLYFTHLSLCLFCLWGIIRFIAVIFNLKHILYFLDNRYLVAFLTVNQFITLIVYTSGQLFSAYPFGFIDFKEANLWGFAEGIYMHFILTAGALFYFFKFQHQTDLNFKKSLWLIAFPVIYGIAVKLIGLYAFKVEWYPYAVFSTQAIWLAVFKTLDGFNPFVASIAIAILAAVVVFVYIGALWLLCFCARKKSDYNAIEAANHVSSR